MAFGFTPVASEIGSVGPSDFVSFMAKSSLFVSICRSAPSMARKFCARARALRNEWGLKYVSLASAKRARSAPTQIQSAWCALLQDIELMPQYQDCVRRGESERRAVPLIAAVPLWRRET